MPKKEKKLDQSNPDNKNEELKKLEPKDEEKEAD